ncbi:UPF0565 protein C2orf69 -like protein [Trichinella pseudospiralis]|uniref:UPF0565 protein C2orf69-like protein n=2 Tax=Trichinella pseudospiralis TaxID=6337 RepID=A0A0V1E1G2_TRIPS|nr:UPF0565 protein C2orf69 -like protein [Trichinella pseudospiralis]KRY82943.1 UPF0565 protein C2orf69 -like protein [Trichinella pseudospiralis]KRZ20778.1 UPF0565 protein C2orf69 -like protein [Trichinella pseudospiralis]KRZ38338.1 UPF0565 protein C2orf69 -like protein [Trichinella pseudospiralis]
MSYVVTATKEEYLITRMHGVEGNCEKFNDILCCRKSDVENFDSFVIFFHGDVQHFENFMSRGIYSKQYIAWSLETTAKLLCKKYPSSFIIIIRASDMRSYPIANYVNFVCCRSSAYLGNGRAYSALDHLSSLFDAVIVKMTALGVKLDYLRPIHLIGFSKGSTVINELILEFVNLIRSVSSPQHNVLNRTVSIHWLDAGHSGNSDVWITDGNLIRELVQALPNVWFCIHLTPYQMKDQNRPWIAEEEKQFSSQLIMHHAKVKRKEYLQDEKVSIETHFRLLEQFDPN